MPFRYEIDRARRVVLSTAMGTVTDEELQTHMRGLAADPNFDPTYRQLVDLRDVSKVDVTSGGLRALGRSNPWKAPTRRAVVCERDVVFGLARMYELLTGDDPHEVRVFREISEALDWLALDTIE
jgi:hypothetical protein